MENRTTFGQVLGLAIMLAALVALVALYRAATPTRG